MGGIKKYLFLTIFVLAAVFVLYLISWSLSPGSYGRAEVYEFDIPEEQLIQIINEVKSENHYSESGEHGFLDHKKGHWYSIYFYENKKVTHTWTRPKNNNSTSFAFVGYQNDKLGNWIDANEYFWWWKNSNAKNEFETTILKKIKEKVKEQKPNKK